MATEKQLEANRRNAKQSTGPRTPEGKLRSSANALKHGMSCDGPVTRASREREIEARKSQAKKDFQPNFWFQTILVEQLAEASVRLEICASNLTAAVARQSRRAVHSWDDDRTLEAVALTLKLPKQPQFFARQITRTKQGCDHLIDRWSILKGFLDSRAGWNAELRSQALDMLGVEQSHRSGRTVLDPPFEIDEFDHLTSIVEQQIAKLENKRAESLDCEDDEDRLETLQGQSIFASREVQLVMRYHGSTFRQMTRLLTELNRSKSNSKKDFDEDDLDSDDPISADEMDLFQELHSAEPEPRPAHPAHLNADGTPNLSYLQPGEKLEDITAGRLVLLKLSGDAPFDYVAAPRKTPTMREIMERTDTRLIVPVPPSETKPIPVPAAIETKPFSVGTPVPVPEKPWGNRAARRQKARKLATAGR